jgi:hypothetical protein
VSLSITAANQAANGLTSPVNGTITSWRVSTNNGFPMALRVLRPVGGTTFTGAGTSATSDPPAGVSPPIATALPIRAGDFIGLNNGMDQFIYGATGGAASTAGAWAPGGQLADGATRAADTTLTNRELLVQATIEPANAITVAKPKLNKKSGTARLTITVPNAGALAYGGSGVKATGPASTTGPQEVLVTVRAKGKKRRALNDKGKVTVKPKITFTPTNGTAAVSTKKVKLKKD